MTNCTYAAMSESNVTEYVSNSFTFFSVQLITSNFSCILTVIRRFFTCIALGNVRIYLRLLLTLVRKTNAVEEETTWAASFYHQPNLTIHVTDGVTVTSLYASLQHKTSAARNRLCQIALNRKLSREFEKWCKFPSRIEAKSRKNESYLYFIHAYLHIYLPCCYLYDRVIPRSAFLLEKLLVA